MHKVLVFGGSGLVGSRFIDLNRINFIINAPDSSEVDILNKDQVLRSIDQSDAEVVINFAAFTDVEAAEKQKGDKNGLAYQLNAIGVQSVAKVCQSLDKHLIHISTEYVFDGKKSNSPYTEEDLPGPINWYGQTKYFGEQSVLESGSKFTLVRISMPYSAYYNQKGDIARFFLGQLRNKSQIRAITDQQISPTLVDDIANVLALLIDRKPNGIYHVASINQTTSLRLAKLMAQIFNLDPSYITPITFEEYNRNKEAKLLKNSCLDCAKFTKEFGPGILHTVEESIELFKQIIDSKGLNQI